MKNICVSHQGHLLKCPFLLKSVMKKSDCPISYRNCTEPSHHVYLQRTKITAYARIQCKTATDWFKERKMEKGKGKRWGQQDREGKKEQTWTRRLFVNLPSQFPFALLACFFFLWMQGIFLYEDNQRDRASKFHNSNGFWYWLFTI